MESFQQILDCGVTSWIPRMGDSTAWGWVMVVLYILSAFIAGRVAFRRPFPLRSRTRESFFWACLCVGLGFLAINKQLDLQTLSTALARCTAVAQGWYDDRRAIQVAVILGLGLFAVLLVIASVVLLRRTMRRSLLPILGAGFVVGFVMIRAVGFYQIDSLIGARLPPALGSVSVNFLLEAPGPLLILLTGIWLLRQDRRNVHSAT